MTTDSPEPADALRSTDDAGSPEQGIPWRAFYDEARERLLAAGNESAPTDARRIVEQASGAESGEFLATLDHPARKRAVAHFDAMLERRLGGEPLQYVLGRWGFRSLDLAVDRRVLIPRPETEGVTELALDQLHRVAGEDRELLAADLGTGSGCIGLSLVAEYPLVRVICTDISGEAVAAARANAAGLGRPAARLTIVQGDWFGGLPIEERGNFDLIVSNPPYVADHEQLPPVVALWEPANALFSGPSGLEAAEILIDEALVWLRPGGALVLELGETQLQAAADRAAQAGYVEVSVHRDLADRDRALVARRG